MLHDKTELCQLAELHRTDKVPSIGHPYTPFYHHLLHDKRKSVRNVLEIGVGGPAVMNGIAGYKIGASLYMWADYFPEAQIVGIDVDPTNSVTGVPRITTFVCNSADRSAVQKLFSGYERRFDLIVDDGAHCINVQVPTLNLFLPYLSDAGIYVIEDCEGPMLDMANWRSHLSASEFEHIVSTYAIVMTDLRAPGHPATANDVLYTIRHKS